VATKVGITKTINQTPERKKQTRKTKLCALKR